MKIGGARDKTFKIVLKEGKSQMISWHRKWGLLWADVLKSPNKSHQVVT